ncbi:MAG: non-heme iron oxygenase ferredoxin subunit [Mycobacteriales bacterium]|nr:MAG: hypothetical protein DLM56_11875 [Pseudonocardiales bacterium]
MTDYTRACSVADVPADSAVHVDLAGSPVAIVHAAGDFYAIHDVCSHEHVALSEGEVDGTTIECWLHGSCFDLATGMPTALPALRPVPVYPVRIDDGDVYVQLTEEK